MQYVRNEKAAYIRWWKREQILRAWDREMMMREESLAWALVVHEDALRREVQSNIDMEAEDRFSRQVRSRVVSNVEGVIAFKCVDELYGSVCNGGRASDSDELEHFLPRCQTDVGRGRVA